MGGLHFVQGLLMLVLSLTWSNIQEFKPQIFTNFLTYDETIGALVNESNMVFELPFGILVAMFLFLSALAHFIIAVPKKTNEVYVKDLENGMNRFRWYEYALSTSQMLVLIAALFGVNDLGALILIFGLNATMNLFGLLMEKMNKGTEKNNVDWTAFIYGSVAGIIPWIVIVLYAFGNSEPSEVPGFVYGIVVSYFIFFNLFPINMVLQYLKVVKWKNYLYGERGYIILSLLAKTVLAWFVLFGVMQPS
jgi:hypothetical protein